MLIWKDIELFIRWYATRNRWRSDYSLPILEIDGIIIVTSPQDLVSMIVEKAVKMADLMQVPIIGVVENYSYFHCPDNGKDYQIFGESHIEEILQKYGLLLLNRLPIDPTIANLLRPRWYWVYRKNKLRERYLYLNRIYMIMKAVHT